MISKGCSTLILYEIYSKMKGKDRYIILPFQSVSFYFFLHWYDCVAPIFWRIYSHWNGFYPSWTDLTCAFRLFFLEKCHIGIALSPHELIQYVYSGYPSENNCSHRFHIGTTFFLHELIWCVLSCYASESNCSHKFHICMVSFLHVLILHVFSG